MKKKYIKKKNHRLRNLIFLAIPIVIIGTTFAKYSENAKLEVAFEAQNIYLKVIY